MWLTPLILPQLLYQSLHEFYRPSVRSDYHYDKSARNWLHFFIFNLKFHPPNETLTSALRKIISSKTASTRSFLQTFKVWVLRCIQTDAKLGHILSDNNFRSSFWWLPNAKLVPLFVKLAYGWQRHFSPRGSSTEVDNEFYKGENRGKARSSTQKWIAATMKTDSDHLWSKI